MNTELKKAYKIMSRYSLTPDEAVVSAYLALDGALQLNYLIRMYSKIKATRYVGYILPTSRDLYGPKEE